jgi:hypothetical protein
LLLQTLPTILHKRTANKTQSRPGHAKSVAMMLRPSPKAGKAVILTAMQQFGGD